MQRIWRRPGLGDVALAAGIGAAIALETILRGSAGVPLWAGALAALAVAVPVVWRRTHPFLMLALTGFLSSGVTATLIPLPLLVTSLALLLVTTYAAGAYGRSWQGAVALTWAVATAQVLAVPASQRDMESLLSTLVLSTLVVLAGRVAAGGAR